MTYSSCCCCLSLKTGSTILGLYAIIDAILMIVTIFTSNYDWTYLLSASFATIAAIAFLLQCGSSTRSAKLCWAKTYFFSFVIGAWITYIFWIIKKKNQAHGDVSCIDIYSWYHLCGSTGLIIFLYCIPAVISTCFGIYFYKCLDSYAMRDEGGLDVVYQNNSNYNSGSEQIVVMQQPMY